MNLNRLLQAIGTVTLAAFVVVAFTPLANVLANQLRIPPEVVPVDAIVVLGAGMYPEGELNRPSLKRAVRGIELYQLGYAPLLVLLGPGRYEAYSSEAEVRSLLARTMQVHPDDIVVEDGGLTTREEAALTRQRLEPLRVQTILLVTESQHLIRAKPLFENVGFEVFAAPADDYTLQPGGARGRLALMKRILEEQAARIYYKTAGYL